MTESKYTDAKIAALLKEVGFNYGQDALESVIVGFRLAERQAAMQGQGGERLILIDLDAENWKAIKQAAQESNWIPPEYFANDWVSDVCNFLKGNSDAIQQPQPVRSVSGEDVAAALKAWYDSPALGREEDDAYAMRAALEHFAAIAQEKQS